MAQFKALKYNTFYNVSPITAVTDFWGSFLFLEYRVLEICFLRM